MTRRDVRALTAAFVLAICWPEAAVVILSLVAIVVMLRGSGR